MAAKISKDELAKILKGVASKSSYDDMQEAIERVADEYGIDLTEVDEEEYEAPDMIFIDEDAEDIFFMDVDEEDPNW